MSSAAAAERGDLRYLTFSIGDRLYALPADAVGEVIRLPHLARLPEAPAGLLGLANLRGQIAPVASVRALVGGEGEDRNSAFALVLRGAAPVALAIDAAPRLVAVEHVQTDEAAIMARPGEKLLGVFDALDGRAAHVLDIKALLSESFVPRARERAVNRVRRSADEGTLRNDREDSRKIITFMVGAQEFALELDAVQEIAPAPAVIAAMPHSEALVLGVTAYRDALLPLLSLRGLLGVEGALGQRPKVVVSRIGGALVGLVADATRAIVTVEAGRADPPPPMLSARTGAESQIKAIYRGERGQRLISILSPELLFRSDIMQRMIAEGPAASSDEVQDVDVALAQFLAFRLGEDEFALPVECVIEVARVPAQITRVPKTPAFLEGVASFRGEVLPVIDQRRRFDMPVREGDETRRVIVVSSAQRRAALIVDAVTEVLSHAVDAVDPAPDVAGRQTRLVAGVINLESADRMVMVLDPDELLTRAEQSLLDAFQPEFP